MKRSNKIKKIKKPKKFTKYYDYSANYFFSKLFKFMYWFFRDYLYMLKHGRPFNEFGVTLFAGKQGAGKSMAMVEYLIRMKTLYPKCIIVTNFGYIHQDQEFNDWKDFFEIRNGVDGVIFAVDEIQNEFNSVNWKEFPVELLSEITQQRKQRIKIVSTSQVFTRVSKQLREQTYEVVEAFTFLNRWTFTKCFDAQEYEAVISNPMLKNKLHRLWRRNFVQDNKIREAYDSYAKIEKMAKTKYLPPSERIG